MIHVRMLPKLGNSNNEDVSSLLPHEALRRFMVDHQAMIKRSHLLRDDRCIFEPSATTEKACLFEGSREEMLPLLLVAWAKLELGHAPQRHYFSPDEELVNLQDYLSGEIRGLSAGLSSATLHHACAVVLGSPRGAVREAIFRMPIPDLADIVTMVINGEARLTDLV